MTTHDDYRNRTHIRMIIFSVLYEKRECSENGFHSSRNCVTPPESTLCVRHLHAPAPVRPGFRQPCRSKAWARTRNTRGRGGASVSAPLSARRDLRHSEHNTLTSSFVSILLYDAYPRARRVRADASDNTTQSSERRGEDSRGDRNTSRGSSRL